MIRYCNPIFKRKLTLFLFFAPFLAGLYFEHWACAASIVLLCFLAHDRHRYGRLILPDLGVLLLAVSIPLLQGLAGFWAVDHGMALMGFAKFLPLPLFLLCWAQLTDEEKADLPTVVPLCGACMTALCAAALILPILKSLVWVNGRMAGCFQYPNTFALFLLVGVIILLSTGCKRPASWLQLTLLLLGISLSGSRTVFFLMLLPVTAFALFGTEKRVRLLPALSFAALALCGAAYVAITGNLSSIGRFLTASLQSSTLQGRLLYWQDALPVIFRHPFGLGYTGYSYLQGSFQTGVYSVTNVHNDWLQLTLDIGWLPALFLLVLVIRAFLSRKTGLMGRLLLLVISLHCMMDFDLQYPVIWFLLLPLLASADTANKRVTALSCRLPTAVLVGVCLYLGTVSGLYYSGHYTACTQLYPRHTQALLAQLRQADTTEQADALADRILSVNQSVSLAWNAKARAAFSAGNIGQMMEYKEQALTYTRYAKEEYLDYFQMLAVGYQLYVQNGDTASAEICRQAMFDIPQRMEAVLESTSPRGWQIGDQPDLSLPEDYAKALQSLAK